MIEIEKILNVVQKAYDDLELLGLYYTPKFICVEVVDLFYAYKYQRYSTLEPEGWHCTMVWSATLGLPLFLVFLISILYLKIIFYK